MHDYSQFPKTSFSERQAFTNHTLSVGQPKFLFLIEMTKLKYSANWIYRLASVTGVEVAIASAVAIYEMQELQVPLGLRSL